ncbi:YoaK family protein [Caulobacter sp. DWR1-3-2b1]|uniref:YoaK family protein n=1 Tax=Caulobacter sp. DWR1-3-2b1 TaxID=2804670 RepID=UPI003CF883CE
MKPTKRRLAVAGICAPRSATKPLDNPVTGYDFRVRTVAICLASLAGYIDALGFMELGGFFVSFMSGNSTRLAVGMTADLANAALAASLILTFLLGVIAGSLVARFAKHHRRAAVMSFVAALLFTAASLNAVGFQHAAIVAMGLAMGAENTVFERDGEVSIGLTYMTGALVKLGQRLAIALTGGSKTAWGPYFLLWSGLVGGAVLGSSAYAHLGLKALWPAAIASVGLSIALARIGHGEISPREDP